MMNNYNRNSRNRSRSDQPMKKTDTSQSNAQLDRLADIAGQQLNTSPQQLKNAVQNGNIQNILSKMPPSQAQQIQKILSDETAAKKLLDSPQARELIRRLSKNE